MKNLMRFLLFILICLISVVFVISRSYSEKLETEYGFLDASEYGVSYYDKSGLNLLSFTPLNDYYYSYDHKEHLAIKITLSKKEDIKKIIKRLFFDNKKLSWYTAGHNSKGSVEINYDFNSNRNEIEIEKEIYSKNLEITNHGDVLKICAGCFITDDKNRLYINSVLINEDKIKIASKMNKILFAVGPNQSFPQDVSKIYILDNHGIVFAEIDSANKEIYYDENWNLIEFKSEFNLTKDKFKTKQTIKLIN